jgi:hypothetical protein
MHELEQVLEEVQIDEMGKLGQALEHARYQFGVGGFLQNSKVDGKYLLQDSRLLKS